MADPGDRPPGRRLPGRELVAHLEPDRLALLGDALENLLAALNIGDAPPAAAPAEVAAPMEVDQGAAPPPPAALLPAVAIAPAPRAGAGRLPPARPQGGAVAGPFRPLRAGERRAGGPTVAIMQRAVPHGGHGAAVANQIRGRLVLPGFGQNDGPNDLGAAGVMAIVARRDFTALRAVVARNPLGAIDTGPQQIGGLPRYPDPLLVAHVGHGTRPESVDPVSPVWAHARAPLFRGLADRFVDLLYSSLARMRDQWRSERRGPARGRFAAGRVFAFLVREGEPAPVPLALAQQAVDAIGELENSPFAPAAPGTALAATVLKRDAYGFSVSRETMAHLDFIRDGRLTRAATFAWIEMRLDGAGRVAAFLHPGTYDISFDTRGVNPHTGFDAPAISVSSRGWGPIRRALLRRVGLTVNDPISRFAHQHVVFTFARADAVRAAINPGGQDALPSIPPEADAVLFTRPLTYDTRVELSDTSFPGAGAGRPLDAAAEYAADDAEDAGANDAGALVAGARVRQFFPLPPDDPVDCPPPDAAKYEAPIFHARRRPVSMQNFRAYATNFSVPEVMFGVANLPFRPGPLTGISTPAIALVLVHVDYRHVYVAGKPDKLQLFIHDGLNFTGMGHCFRAACAELRARTREEVEPSDLVVSFSNVDDAVRRALGAPHVGLAHCLRGVDLVMRFARRGVFVPPDALFAATGIPIDPAPPAIIPPGMVAMARERYHWIHRLPSRAAVDLKLGQVFVRAIDEGVDGRHARLLEGAGHAGEDVWVRDAYVVALLDGDRTAFWTARMSWPYGTGEWLGSCSTVAIDTLIPDPRTGVLTAPGLSVNQALTAALDEMGLRGDRAPADLNKVAEWYGVATGGKPVLFFRPALDEEYHHFVSPPIYKNAAGILAYYDRENRYKGARVGEPSPTVAIPKAERGTKPVAKTGP